MTNNDIRAPFPKLLLIALALSILTLPLVLLTKVSVGSSQFSVSYLFICVVLGWTALAALHRISPRQRSTLGGAAALPAAFFFTVVLYTIANGVDTAFLMNMLFWIGASYLGLLMDPDLARKLAKQMRAITFFAAILGIFLYVVNFPLLDIESLASDMYFVNDWGHYRAASIFLNPNSFAYFLVFSFCIYLFGPDRLNMWRILSLACGLVAFVLTGSRSGFIALAVLVCFWMARWLRPGPRFILYSITNLALLSLLVILVILSEYLVGYDVRFEKWAFSVELFLRSQEFWLTGMPVDVQLENLGMFFSDNMFLTFLFRMGVFGFLFFGLYYLYILWRAMQCLIWGEPTARPFAAFSIVCSILLFYSNFLYLYPLVLLHGIAVGQVLRAEKGSPSTVSIKVVQ
ncbi:O-antigen ligase family protein [Uliginosibacterium sp. sgz301328]|uniref:O-antigen ligase family protein n=1 Tax=Uliginosibacterium sp. sgz301328 TaxID=3243764 RepID=UPI00359DCA7B